MLIGELARQAGTSARTLRYYEAQGLVRPRRCANGCPDSISVLLRKLAEVDAGLARLAGVREQLRCQLDRARADRRRR